MEPILDINQIANTFFNHKRPLSATFFQLLKYANAIGADAEVRYDGSVLSVYNSKDVEVFHVVEKNGNYKIKFISETYYVTFGSSSKTYDNLKKKCEQAAGKAQELGIKNPPKPPIEKPKEDPNEDPTEKEPPKKEVVLQNAPLIDTPIESDEEEHRWKKVKGFAANSKKAIACATVILAFFIAAAAYNNMPKLSQNISDLDYGEEYSVEDLISVDKEDAEVILSDGKKSFSPYKLGENSLTFIIKRGDKKSEKKFAFNVVDNVPPTISCKDEYQITQFDSSAAIKELLLEECQVSDNCDTNISIADIEVGGNVDTFYTGSNEVVLTVADASGNITHKNVSVEVVEKYEDSINAVDAKHNIGRYCTVLGDVYSTSYRPDVRGQPTFINVSDHYPAYNGMQIVIWGDNRTPAMVNLCEQLERNTYIAVHGYLQIYNGIPEIIVYSTDQIEILGTLSVGT